MERSAGSFDTVAPRAFVFGVQRVDTAAPDFGSVIASAHASGLRPRCCCQPAGVEMYIARSISGYVLKRMPYTGSHHAPDCLSYEPPDLATGWGEVAGSAIREDPLTGETALRLDFALSKLPGQSAKPSAGAGAGSASTTGVRLSLRGLLHFLWHEAGLTRWHPGFEGKRNWALVRRLLLQAIERKVTNSGPLSSRVYVPEPFQIDQRDAIHARRLVRLRSAVQVRGRPQHLQLLIAEVKELVPARYGYRAFVKHVPDQAFGLDAQLYRRLGRRFATELELWGASDEVRMVAMATFGVTEAGIPGVVEITLMPVTHQWIPVENSFEKDLVERLVRERRSFVKGLRYNLGVEAPLANATLTDTGTAPVPLCIVPSSTDDYETSFGVAALAFAAGALNGAWRWAPSSEAMPPFPPAVADRMAGRVGPG